MFGFFFCEGEGEDGRVRGGEGGRASWGWGGVGGWKDGGREEGQVRG